MATRPLLTPGDAPLDPKRAREVLSHLGDAMVLVGGQALAFWMDRYGLLPPGELVTQDGDAIGQLASAMELARALHARVLEPRKTARTALVAQLRIPAGNGQHANMDILHQLYTVDGLKKSAEFTRRVVRDSVKVQWHGEVHVRVMDPFDLLESRVHNAAGLLAHKGVHVLTQATWAVGVARQALLRIAQGEVSAVTGRLGQTLQGIYTLAHSRAGRSVLRDHGIEVLDAVDQAGLRKLAPAHLAQLDKLAAALLKRRANP